MATCEITQPPHGKQYNPDCSQLQAQLDRVGCVNGHL
jgi:hypothetical protein